MCGTCPAILNRGKKMTHNKSRLFMPNKLEVKGKPLILCVF